MLLDRGRIKIDPNGKPSTLKKSRSQGGWDAWASNYTVCAPILTKSGGVSIVCTADNISLRLYLVWARRSEAPPSQADGPTKPGAARSATGPTGPSHATPAARTPPRSERRAAHAHQSRC